LGQWYVIQLTQRFSTLTRNTHQSLAISINTPTLDPLDIEPEGDRQGDLIVQTHRLVPGPYGRSQTDLRNTFRVGIPPVVNLVTRLIIQPTLLGPVVRFLNSTLLEADSEYTLDCIYLYWSAHRQHALKPSSGGKLPRHSGRRSRGRQHTRFRPRVLSGGIWPIWSGAADPGASSNKRHPRDGTRWRCGLGGDRCRGTFSYPIPLPSMSLISN
jgi:hypothetical protein